MTTYLPYIFGTTSLLGGVYLFLYSFKIYKPKLRTDEAKFRYRKSLERFGTIAKVASIILIISGGYDLITRDSERYSINSTQRKSEWTNDDRNQLINECIQGAGETGEQYPILIMQYCECSAERIMTAFSKDQYIRDSKLAQDERLDLLLPAIQDCIDILKVKIDSASNRLE